MPTAHWAFLHLKNHEIIQRFRSVITGIMNYYWPISTFKSTLNRYYYLMKFNCLKTLARRNKTSIVKITKTYGPFLNIKWEEKTKEKKWHMNYQRKTNKLSNIQTNYE